jgi:hypothetical protein
LNQSVLLPIFIEQVRFMAENEAPLPESSVPRRPWYRLHLSTRIVLLFMLAILVLLIVPGELQESLAHLDAASDADTWSYHCLEHGWPWEYLDRYLSPESMPDNYYLGLDDPPWFHWWNWRVTSDKAWFSPLALLLDVSVAAAIFSIVALVAEWRLRRGIRIWQFTLYEIILFTTVAAGALAWWRTNHVRAQGENDFIAADLGDEPFVRFREYKGPTCLTRLLGIGCLRDLFTVTFYWVDNTDDRPRKAKLSLSNQLPNIKRMECIQASRADIQEISRLRHLERLGVHDSILSDDDYTRISAISSLQMLSLKKTPITTKSVLSLQSLPRLESLGITESDLGDESSRALAGLENLRHLDLHGTRISNASVSYISNLKRLETLDIKKTNITPRGYLRLRRLLPKCEIVYSDDQKQIDAAPDLYFNEYFWEM